MKQMKLISFLLLGLALAGCATVNTKHFYGIGMNSIKDAKDFKIILNSKGEMSYYENERTMNSDISAWAEIEDPSLFIVSITNNTKNPIQTNYFSDDFELMDKDGRTFKLEKYDITLYPEANYINPGETVKFPIVSSLSNEKFTDEIIMIICTLGSPFERVKIILKPVPQAVKNR